MTRWIRSCTLTVALCAPSAAVAGDPPLELAEAQREARRHAPDGAALAARVRAAELVSADARRRTRLDPQLSLRYGVQLGSYEEHDVVVGLRWPVEMSGARKLRERAARADHSASAAEREVGMLALDEAVAVAVADLALAQRRLARSQRVRDLHRTAVEAEQRRLDVGSGTQLDVDGAELDAIAAEAGVVDAMAAVELGGIRLARLLGRSRGPALAVADPDELADEQADSRTAIVEQDPRVRAAAATTLARRARAEASARVARPTPTFGVDFGWRRNDVPSSAFRGDVRVSALWTEYELGLSLGLPLPLFDRNREARARAQGDVGVAIADHERVRVDVEAEVELALVDYRAALTRVRALARTDAIVERDFALLEQALATGTMDALVRAVALRRLEGGAAQLDAAVHELRVARARWVRRSREPNRSREGTIDP